MADAVAVSDGGADEMIADVVVPRTRVLADGVDVARTLPRRTRRTVGPFVIADLMGPLTLEAGSGIDVPPHPHIGLSTITLLFDGALVHRDSLGVEQVISPGEVNWMTAGRGIVHSERSPDDERRQPSALRGLQTWVALPRARERSAPSLHRAADELPAAGFEDADVRVLVGRYAHLRSPVRVTQELVEAEIRLPDDGATHTVRNDHDELGLQLVEGAVVVDGRRFVERELVVLKPSACPEVCALDGPARLVALGGDRLDSPRHLRWNFVASEMTALDQAEQDWRARRFPTVPGDDDRVEIPPAPAGIRPVR